MAQSYLNGGAVGHVGGSKPPYIRSGLVDADVGV